jgi:hypothetical protein
MRRMLFACAASLALLGMVACDDVSGPTGEPVDLVFRPCAGSADVPTWLAVQDGEGAWQRITPTSGSYNFTFSSGRGGVAMFTEASGLFIIYASTEEFQSTLPSCAGSTRNVTGTVTGYVSLDRVRLTVGDGADEFPGASYPAPTAWGVADVSSDVTDVVGVRYRVSAGTTTVIYEETPSSVFLRRGVTGSSTPTVDFTSATDAGAPLQRTLGVTNIVSGEELVISSNVALTTTVGSIAIYRAQASAGSGTATGLFYGIPGSRLTAGETQVLGVSATRAVGSADESRFATLIFTDPVDRTMTLGPVLGPVTITGSSRPSAAYTVQSDYGNLFEVVFSQQGANVDLLATKDYLGSTTGSVVTLTVPNLTGVAGFSSSWLLTPGQSSSAQFLATNADLSILISQALTYQGAERIAPFTP